MIMNSHDIQQVIPHRHPFLLIDQVLSMEAGKSITAIKNVTTSEYYFQGHFPEEPVMPGVLIIEAMAQAGAVTLLSLDAYKNKIAYFAGLNNVRFKRKVVPGDQLRLEVEITRIKRSIGKGIGYAYVNDTLACSAEITFAIGQ